ncbi:hypothetical protein Tco_1230682 [Tanacetum coccineum]
MERAATTASSLEAEQDSGSGPRCQDTILGDVDSQTRFETTSKQSNDPPLSRGYTLVSGEDSVKFLELMELCTKLSNMVLKNRKSDLDSAKLRTVNRDVQIQALIDRKKIIVNEASIRRDLKLEDAEGSPCLPNATIFEELTRMEYEKVSQKLTFYKAFFSPQWKFLIHTILQCISAKTTAWNEFSSTMTSAIICLANNQKFNFSKYIFDSMVKNLENVNKFWMYPRFVQVLDLEKAKFDQAIEIASLKKRVEKLERRRKFRTTRLRRLKKGRSIEDIDADIEVTLVNENQERQDEDLMFDTGVLDDDEMFVDATIVTTASVEDSVPPTIPTTVVPTIPKTVEETLAQTLMPEDEHERVLWGDLKVMFEPDIKSDVWRNLQGYKVTIWKLFDSCGVHFVRNLKIQKMNIKFRGGLLGLKRLQGFLELLLLSTTGTKVYAAGLQLLEDLLLSRG